MQSIVRVSYADRKEVYLASESDLGKSPGDLSVYFSKDIAYLKLWENGTEFFRVINMDKVESIDVVPVDVIASNKGVHIKAILK